MAFSNSFDNPAAPGTGAGVGNREDLTNILSQLDPVSSPLVSLSPKRKASGTNHEWQMDQLSAPAHTGLLEGADVTSFDDKFEDRIRIGNVCQGFRRNYGVSQVQQAVSSAGNNAGRAEARVKCMRELKRDIEAAVWSNQVRTTGSGSTKSLLQGMTTWLTTALADVPSQYRIGSDQVIAATVTENGFNAALASMFNVSGNLSTVTAILDTRTRRSVSEFMRMDSSYDGSGNADNRVRYTVSGTGKSVHLQVDFFHSDFGSIKVMNSNPDTSQDTSNHDRGLLVNFDYIGIAELIPLKTVDFEDQGGGARGMTEAWLTLECHDPRAHAIIDEGRS